ncbi:hypothetical protein J6P92_09545 [bacterium]|nr:hypothetical protein [bacterium]
MGMSASQARLLSITSRLTNNEFRAQTITNSKLRLADESTAAGRVYMDALRSNKLMLMNYDEQGYASTTALTAAAIYDYAPMKNQYSLINTAGKILVSALDAKNYNETDNLGDFLERYDLVYKMDTSTNITEIPNPEYEQWEKDKEADKPDKTDPVYWDTTTTTTKGHDLYDQFVWGTRVCFAAGMSYLLDKLGKPAMEVKDSKGNIVSKISPSYNFTIYDKGDTTSGITEGRDDVYMCWCYKHIFDHLLPEGSYTSSTGQTFNVYESSGGGAYNYEWLTANPNNNVHAHWWQNTVGADDYGEYYDDALELADAAANNGYECCDDSTFTAASSDIEKLMSDYNVDGSKKSLQQKIVDLDCLYDVLYKDVIGLPVVNPTAADYEKYIDYSGSALSEVKIAQILYDAIMHFMEHDLKGIETESETEEDVFKEDEYEEDIKEWEEKWKDAPPKTITAEEESVSTIILRDQEKSQWYTNLWNAMNGSTTSNTVDPVNFDNDIRFIQTIPDDIRGEYRFIVESKPKDTRTVNYELFDSNLFGSEDWLKFALEHGIVSMVQAQYYNPDENDNKAPNASADGFKWKPIVYTSAPDIIAQDNETEIAKAETTYKRKLRDIKAQDGKFDQDLKKLDVEHNALQTEYESIKNVIAKNVERSFKAFS